MTSRMKKAANDLRILGESTKTASVPSYEKEEQPVREKTLEDKIKEAGFGQSLRGFVNKIAPDLDMNFGELPGKVLNYAKENPGKSLGLAGAGLAGLGLYGGARLAGKAIKGYKNRAALYGGGALAGIGGLSYMAGKGSGESQARRDYTRSQGY